MVCNCHDYYIIKGVGKTKTSYVIECKIGERGVSRK